jgi:hypothetical protein
MNGKGDRSNSGRGSAGSQKPGFFEILRYSAQKRAKNPVSWGFDFAQPPGVFFEILRYSAQKLAKNPVSLVLMRSTIGFKYAIF